MYLLLLSCWVQGETEVLEFKIPTEKGSYEFVCTFPGHFAMMRGIMEVK